MRSILASLSLAAGLLAQQPLLEINFAADPGKNGPSAWTWVRTELFTGLPSWPKGKDPLSSVRLRIDDPSHCVILPGSPSGDHYLTASVHPSTGCAIAVSCQFTGLETWDVEGMPSGRFADLVTLLGLDLGHSPLTFNSLAVTSTILGGTVEGDHLGHFISWGAEECGELDLTYWRTESGLRIRGVSKGGILLAAILTVLADWHSHPADSLATPGREISRADHLILLAVAARHEERSEAIRQLSVLDDPRVVSVLERLLLEDDHTRLLTMNSLVRSKSSKSLPRLLAAGSPLVQGSEAMAQVALWTLWPGAEQETRHKLRRHLNPAEASALDAWHLGEGRRAPAENQVSTRAKASASGDLHRAAWIGMWITLGALGMMYLRARRGL